ncbi:MAG: carboxypeptidase-like regulatory domain-containing protein, partial [Bacteroidota bacterium]|nr:carboxypeptidase-like regulatory domain-containing protein [Bacteroidota bacterium]
MKIIWINANRFSLFLIINMLLALWPSETLEAAMAPPPQATVTGTVTDANGNPLVGVSIQVEATQRGTITDMDGSFSIQANPDDTLYFSIIGFKPLTVGIKGRNVVNVQMEEDVTQLGEVVLNAGYYTVSEKERTGNIATI